MTFDTNESSQQGGTPVELYTITIGATILRYTSAEDDFTEAGDEFRAVPIQREKLSAGGQDARVQSLVLTLPGDDPLARRYITSVPGTPALVAIERLHREDGASPEVVRIFEGEIESVAFEKEGRVAKLQLQPRIAAQSRPVPRFGYQGLCNNVVYDDLCRADDTDPLFRLSSATVTAESGNDITVAGAGARGDNYYTGGYVEAGGGADFRLVLRQIGNVLTLSLPFTAAVLGTQVTVLAGCDHTIATCKAKFDNVINFGGFAYVPSKNIFNTGLTT